MKKWLIIVTGVIIIAVVAGLAAEQRAHRKVQKNDGNVTEAMYIPYGDSSYIMMDQKNGTPFTVTAPPAVYDRNGKKITLNELKKGNIVDIYGDGIMAESYPGQYHGVTKIQVTNEGSPGDANQYQTIIDSIYTEPDPSKHPYLNLEYTTDSAAVTVAATEGGFSWSYRDEAGEERSVAACGLNILLWPDIVDVALEKPTDLTLIFSKKPIRVTVTRFLSTYLGSQEYVQDDPSGEVTATVERDGNLVIEDLRKGYVYLIQGEWENGTADYGFLTK